MKKLMAVIAASVALSGILNISGCCLFFPEKSQAPALSMFVDVPVPQELAIDEKHSQVYEHPIGRVGVMKTAGRISKDAAISFYLEAMAHNGWVKESEFDNGERQMIVFSKNPRSAAITIREGWLSTEVEINVSAKQSPPQTLQ